MNRPEAEKLLGGYATGSLTDSEKQALFTAALEDQELFDALVDEETLRELLADPEVRKRLLSVLPQPEGSQPKIKKLWRRPTVLGLVASLFVLVATSYVVLQRTGPALSDQKIAQQRKEETQNLGAVMVAKSPSQDKEEPVTPSSPVQGYVSPGKAKAAFPATARGRAVPPAGSEQSESEKGQEKESKADVAQAGVVAEAMAPSPKLARAAKPQEMPADFAVSESNRLSASGAPALAARGGVKSEASKRTNYSEASKEISELQVSSLEHLQGGRARLNVNWGPDGHLYVLKRSPSGVVVLPILKSIPGKTGTQMTTFEFPLGEKDVLDVYVLRTPVSDPEALPASGDVQGDRRRVNPE